MSARTAVRLLVCVACAATWFDRALLRADDAAIRPTAVVDLSFDETEGPAEDRAASGATKDAAQPVNAPERIASPFWNAQSGQAMKFDSTRTQFLQIADSPDLDHVSGSTVSFYLLNLHKPTDSAFHGIVAKRSGDEQKSNYGFNFQPSSKKLQVYIHDGTGYKVVGFPVEDAFGVRRLVHLTATFRPGDAPDTDADNDADDLEIKLYVNGKPIKPMDSVNGFVLPDAGWIVDVNYEGLLSDAPLTIGSSFPNGEPFSGLIDEFLLFNRPLSGDEVSHLFLEVAGSNGEQLAGMETQAPATLAPTLTEVSPRGVQVGATTRLTLVGQNLAASPELTLLGTPFEGSQIVEATADRIVADITIPAEASPRLLPLAVRTEHGVSPPIPLPADRFRQRLYSDVSPGQSIELPAAYTGVLNGNDRHRMLIEGKAGQKLVVEVELKRLGGTADPVLELKTAEETPLDVAWGRSQRGGDPRLVTTLPNDGRYLLELHDLAYNAPRSQFRLLVGDLQLIDAVIPPATASAESAAAKVIGVGLAESTVTVSLPTEATTATISGPAAEQSHGLLPPVTHSDGHELSETDAAAQVVELSAPDQLPTYVTGQLTTTGETDRFSFRVQAGKELTLRADAKSLGSPVEPDVVVLQNGRRIGRAASKPGDGLATLAITPKADGQIEVEVSDRLRSHGEDRLYRVRIAPTDSPLLKVTFLDGSVVLPTTGRGVTRLRIERSGILGDVRLIADPTSGVTLEPAVIAAGPSPQDVFLTIKTAGAGPAGPTLRITAEADGPNGVLRRPVQATPGGTLSGFDVARIYHEVPIVSANAAPAVELVKLPPAAFKGATESIGLQVVGEIPEGRVVRFSLVSDEAPRPVDPKNPAAGNKPLIRVPQDTTLARGAADAVIPIEVPSDLAITQIEAVIKAEVVPHAWSNHVEAVGYSAPLQLAVQDAIVNATSKTAAVLKTGENNVAVVIERQSGFTLPVRVELRGLPAGVTVPAIELPADTTEAHFTVTVPPGAPVGPVADAKLVVLGPNGAELKTVASFAVEVQP